MAIAVTPTGEIITVGGLPSCICCGDECMEQTTICMAFNDYAIGLQNVTLTGSLNGGSFSGIYDPCGSAYTIELIWDGTAWGFWYNSVRLLDDPPTSTATISGETVRCNPVGATISFEDALIIVEAEVLGFGECPCPCDPDYTSIYADVDDGGTVASIEFVGSLCSGEFFCDIDNSFLRWTGCEWVWDTLGVEYPADPPITGRCDVGTIGGVFDSGRILTITGAA